MYCVARMNEHACRYEIADPIEKRLYDGTEHPGDKTDHECHCGHTWENFHFQDGTRPQIIHMTREGDWQFGIDLWSTLSDGPIFQLYFGKRGIHLPLRWRPWRII